MRVINKIEPKVPQMPTRKKVAAYARVSMESERLQHSLSAQVSYYSGLIQKNPAWEYVGVYADDGVTGTKAGAREEFNRMLADCKAVQEGSVWCITKNFYQESLALGDLILDVHAVLNDKDAGDLRFLRKLS